MNYCSIWGIQNWSLSLRWICRSSCTTRATPPIPRAFCWRILRGWVTVAAMPWNWHHGIVGGFFSWQENPRWAHGHMAKSISAILREKSNFDGVYHSFPHKNGRIFCIFPFWEKPMVVPHERCVLVQVAYQEFRLLAGCGGTQANDPAWWSWRWDDRPQHDDLVCWGADPCGSFNEKNGWLPEDWSPLRHLQAATTYQHEDQHVLEGARPPCPWQCAAWASASQPVGGWEMEAAGWQFRGLHLFEDRWWRSSLFEELQPGREGWSQGNVPKTLGWSQGQPSPSRWDPLRAVCQDLRRLRFRHLCWWRWIRCPACSSLHERRLLSEDRSGHKRPLAEASEAHKTQFPGARQLGLWWASFPKKCCPCGNNIGKFSKICWDLSWPLSWWAAAGYVVELYGPSTKYLRNYIRSDKTPQE